MPAEDNFAILGAVAPLIVMNPPAKKIWSAAFTTMALAGELNPDPMLVLNVVSGPPAGSNLTKLREPSIPVAETIAWPVERTAIDTLAAFSADASVGW